MEYLDHDHNKHCGQAGHYRRENDMNLSEAPDITVPLSVGGYIGFTLLGLVALAVLIFASLVIPVHGSGGLVVAGLGSLLFMYAAFAYLRTVEMGWHWPNVAVWAGLLASGVAATFAVNFIATGRGGYAGVAAWVPIGGVAVGSVIAGLFDALNEFLGGIPLSWGAAGLLVALAFAFVLSRR